MRRSEGEPAVHPVRSHINSSHIEIQFASCSRGTFGVVKRVVHRRTGEVFAAKFLPLRSSTRTRAFQERDLLSRLAHPRVACLLDFFCTKRTLVLITEMYPLFLRHTFPVGFICQALCEAQSSLTSCPGAVLMDFWTICY